MLTFQQFSDLVNGAAIIFFIVNLAAVIMYFKVKPFRNYLSNVRYDLYIWKIFLLTLAAVVAANIYDFVYGDAPCVYCWYARTLIYPILFISAFELFKKTKIAHLFLGLLASLAAILTAYHYSFHFRRYVLGDIFMPCSTNPLLPDCTSAKVVSFGFATMPMMGLILSLCVLFYCYLASKTKNK